MRQERHVSGPGPVVIMIAGVIFVREYINTTDLKESLTYGLAIIFCLLAIGFIKLMSYQQMIKLELMREFKRLEMRTMVAVDRNGNDKRYN